MPVDRSLGEDLARTLVDLYGDAEQRLIEDIARRLRSGLDRSDWAERKLAQISQVRELADRIIDRLDSDLAEQVEQMLVLAYVRGGEAALDELGRAAGVSRQELAEIRRELPGSAAIQRLVWSLTSTLRGTHLRILRWPLDAYRQVVATAAADTLLGTATRLRTAQVAWERLLARGITGFVDRSGRSWELASYVEMATRTTVAQAAVEGHLDRLAAAGLDLVIVSNAPQECGRCRPYEGAVLTRRGPGGRRTVQARSVTTGRTVTVDVRGSVDEAIRAGLLHPNCFPGEVLVSAPSSVVAADARWYEGPLVVIHTASGNELPVTPNHPVLTPEGWVPAGLLNVGQSVLRYRSDVERASLGTPDDEQIPARIGDVFDALREASPVPAVRVPVAPEQFHGDGFGTDVDVVLADSLLRNGTGQECGHHQFIGSGVRAGSLLADSALDEVFLGAFHPAHSGVGGGNLGGTLLGAHTSPFPALGVAGVGAVTPTEQGSAHGGLLAADLDSNLALRHAFEVEPDSGLNPIVGAPLRNASSTQFSVEGGTVDSHGGRDLAGALSVLVAPDRILKVEERREWAGHVYNLQTRDGWYVAGGIVVHNCRHSLSAYLPGVTRAPRNTADPEGDAARQELRRLERQVRHWKRREAGALTPEAKAKAAAKVRDYQRQIREHVADTGLIRQRHREQIGTAR